MLENYDGIYVPNDIIGCLNRLKKYDRELQLDLQQACMDTDKTRKERQVEIAQDVVAGEYTDVESQAGKQEPVGALLGKLRQLVSKLD